MSRGRGQIFGALPLAAPRKPNPQLRGSLGGSWVVISGVISRVTALISHIRGLITPLYNYP